VNFTEKNNSCTPIHIVTSDPEPLKPVIYPEFT
jgi:hypothetical protein